jgi:plasmid stability protein
MSIHPNAPSRPSKSDFIDPEELLETLLRAEPRPRRRDAEREVIKQFSWWNPWKPGWRPPGFSSPQKDVDRQQAGDARRSSYQARREEVLRQRRHRERFERQQDAWAKQQKHTDSRAPEENVAEVFQEGDKAIAAWTSAADKSSYDDLLVEHHHTPDDVVGSLFAALNRMKDERDQAISLISTLVKERTRIRAHMTTKSRSPEQRNSLYQMVGLDENCPDFILKAARTAYRKQFHPDVHPERDREGAENRFKEVEAVFAEIMRLRDG